MLETELRWFSSAVDWFIGSILVVVPVVELVSLASAFLRGDREGVLALLMGLAVVAIVYFSLVIPVRYGVGDHELVVRFGVVRHHIPYESIREVRPSHSPLSSAALSLDRLAIRTGAGPLNLTLISPLPRDEFLALLSAKARLVRDGERFVPNNSGSSV